MVRVDVDCSRLQADSVPKSVGLLLQMSHAAWSVYLSVCVCVFVGRTGDAVQKMA